MDFETLPCQFLAAVPGLHTQKRSLSLRVVISQPVILDLFTDGSCLFPTNCSLRVASWAVVLGRPFQLDFGSDDFVPLAAPPLPGLIQTAYRAELFAIQAALQYAVVSGRGVRIWTDCQSAIAAFAMHMSMTNSRCLPTQSTVTCCGQYSTLLGSVESGCVAVLKVPAHTSLATATTDLERWLFTGNAKADQLAKAANEARPETIWSLWSAFSAQLDLCQEQADAARAFLLAVSKFWNDNYCQLTRPVAPQVSRPTRAAQSST